MVGAAAALGYWLLAGDPPQPAFATAVAVLVAACPCALAVAPPPALDRAARVDTVALAESVAVDPAALRVHAVHATHGVGATAALRLAGAIGRSAEHPIGRAIAASAAVATGPLPGVAEFDDVPGLGWRGIVAEVVRRSTDRGTEQAVVAHAVLAGRPELLAEHGIGMPADLAAACAGAAGTGRTAVTVAWDGMARAVLVIGAAARPTAAAAVGKIRALGLTPMLLARDGSATALAAAGQVGIHPDEMAADVPALERLRAAGRVVAVIGEDGTQDDPLAAVEALGRARRAAAVIRWNAVLATIAAVVPLPFAVAGALDPTLAAAIVVTFSVVVLGNGLRLHGFAPTSG
ncbi:hypothetical protein BJF78_24060 [Pseudonocardia sp. CNS-139]|nr:hypothetical protein BJF78_24060 [Pseudonocardia sp. CNS-139]